METHLSRSKSDFRCPYLVNFLFIQCLGDGKVTRFFAKAFVFLKNISMFFMVGVLQLLHEKFLLFCPVDLIGLSCV